MHLTKIQRHILNETGAELFGPCVALQTTGSLHRELYGPSVINVFGVRKGTLSDAQMRRVLEPGQKIADKDTAYFMSEALFFTLWTEFAGKSDTVKMGTPAADRLLELCDNYIADPQDLWPVLWKLANDGRDAPELPPSKLYVSPPADTDGNTGSTAAGAVPSSVF